MLRSVSKAGHSVGITVKIYKYSVLGNSIRTGYKPVTSECFLYDLFFFFLCFGIRPVIYRIIALLNCIKKTYLCKYFCKRFGYLILDPSVISSKAFLRASSFVSAKYPEIRRDSSPLITFAASKLFLVLLISSISTTSHFNTLFLYFTDNHIYYIFSHSLFPPGIKN